MEYVKHLGSFIARESQVQTADSDIAFGLDFQFHETNRDILLLKAGAFPAAENRCRGCQDRIKGRLARFGPFNGRTCPLGCAICRSSQAVLDRSRVPMHIHVRLEATNRSDGSVFEHQL